MIVDCCEIRLRSFADIWRLLAVLQTVFQYVENDYWDWITSKLTAEALSNIEDDPRYF